MNWLLEPIPRWRALSGVLISNIGMVALLLEKQAALKNAAEVHADQCQRNIILKEICDFLIDRADDATAVELNKNLDYWRIIRGVD